MVAHCAVVWCRNAYLTAGTAPAEAVGPAMDDGMRAATEGSLAELSAAVTPWRSERTIPTLADRPIDPETAIGADVAKRLREVEAAHDPDGRFTRI